MADNKQFYTFQRISPPKAISLPEFSALVRKINDILEQLAMKVYGSIQEKDLHRTLGNVIKSKVGNDEFDTEVTQLSNSIALKANQTTVDTLSGTVSAHGTEITANANAIALKASQTSLDSLGSTVSSLSAELDLVPGAITAEVTNGTTHVSETPPTGAGLYVGRIWHIPSTGEQVRWKGIVANSARKYAVTNNTPTVRIDDLSDDLEIAVTTAAAATVTLTKKNLLKKGTTVTLYGVTLTIADDGTITITGTCTAAAGSPVLFQILMGYYLSGQHTLSAGNTVAYGADLQMRLLQALNTAVASPTTNFSVNSIGAKSTFTLSNQFVYGYAIRVQGGVTYNATLKPQLEKAAAATTYEAPDHVVYTADASGNAAVIGRDGVNCIISSALSLSCAYTGSGWALVSGTAKRLYAGANYKLDENGLEITQTALDGSPIATKHLANAQQYGLFRVSDGKMLQGAKVLPSGVPVAITNAMMDPDGDGSSLFVMQTSDGKTLLSLDMDSYEGVTSEANPTPSGRMSGIKMGAINGWTWQVSDYADDWYSYLTGRGLFEVHSDGQLVLTGENGVVFGYIAGDYTPDTTNVYNMGSATRGLKKYYGASTSIQSTSDERAKCDFQALDPAMMMRFLSALNPTWYRLNDVPQERAAGFRAQQFRDAMKQAGMPDDYAGFNGADPDHLCLDYGQVIAPLVSVARWQQKRIDDLEGKYSLLEKRLTDLIRVIDRDTDSGI